MKSFYLKTKTLGLILACCIITSCANGSKERQETNTEANRTLAITIDTTASQAYIVDGQAIPFKIVQDLYFGFALAYQYGINTDIAIKELNVKWKYIDSFTDITLYKNCKDSGYALFYIIDTDAAQQKYFTYAISAAKFDNQKDTVKPLPDASGNMRFLVIQSNGQTREIDSNEFKNARNEYFNKVKVRGILSQDTISIKYVKGAPLSSFYSGSEVYHFFNDNNYYRNSAQINDSLYLRIYHGGVNSSMPPDHEAPSLPFATDLLLHTPILVFEYNNTILCSTGPNNRKYPYEGKALEVGRLCPPECD